MLKVQYELQQLKHLAQCSTVFKEKELAIYLPIHTTENGVATPHYR
jgi:hypothetical protein